MGEGLALRVLDAPGGTLMKLNLASCSLQLTPYNGNTAGQDT